MLDLARNKLGSKNAWSIDGMIFVKKGPNIRKIRSADDLIGEGSSALLLLFSCQFVQCHVVTLCSFNHFLLAIPYFFVSFSHLCSLLFLSLLVLLINFFAVRSCQGPLVD